jgi:hypothetical protein
LQENCGSLGPGHIEALLRKWLRILSNPFTVTDEDVTAGYRDELSILQAEFCRGHRSGCPGGMSARQRAGLGRQTARASLDFVAAHPDPHPPATRRRARR